MLRKEHHFCIEDAEKYGVIKAILLYNLYYWLDLNQKNKTHAYDGYYWTYNSATAFSNLFPYLSVNQIQDHLKTLEAEGVIKVGNYNKAKYDHTKWYTIPAFYQIDLTVSSDRTDNTVKPIPDSKPNTNTDNPMESSDFEKFWIAYPKKEAKTKALVVWKKKKFDKYLPQILAFINKAKETDRWTQGYIKQPTAFLNGQCWEDDLSSYGSAGKEVTPGVYKSKNGYKPQVSIKG